MNREDLDQLPALHATGDETETRRARSQAALVELFPRLFLDHPWHNERIRSLVSEEADGHINGAMGIMSRPMLFRDTTIQMAVATELYVEPCSRPKMVGIHLLRSFLHGPQDLSFSDISNTKSRMIWERLGGRVAPLYNVNWIRPLRLAQFLLALARHKQGIRWPALAGIVPAKLLDRIFGRWNFNPFRTSPSLLRAEPLTPELFVEQFHAFAAQHVLRPIYDAGAIPWQWSRLDFLCRDSGPSRQVAVRDNRGCLVGWYIYQCRPGGIGKVAQVVARQQTIANVLRHLFQDAFDQGAVGLIGRLQPSFLQAFADNGCLLHPRQTFTLVHSQDPELLEAFQSGDAFVTLLEGEASLDIWNAPFDALAAHPAREHAVANSEPERACKLQAVC